MKKIHCRSSKFHIIYSAVLAVIFTIVIIIKPDIFLGIAMVLLLAYVVGNGLIHANKNVLERDTIFEYIIVSLIVFFVIASVLWK